MELPLRTGPSGVGEDHYDWYLKHVHLVLHHYGLDLDGVAFDSLLSSYLLIPRPATVWLTWQSAS